MAYPDAIGGGTLADMGSGNLANYMPSYWAKKTLDFVMKELVAWPTIDLSYGDEWKAAGGKGDTIIINPLLEVTASAVNTDAAPTVYDADQGTPISLIINNWYQAAVGVNDAQTRFGQPDYEARVLPKLSYAISKQIDTSVGALFNGFSQYVGTEGVAVDFDTLLSAKTYLDLAGAPDRDRYLVIDPETLQDLMGDDRFTSSLYGGDGAVAKGFIGQSKVLGCTVLMTNNLAAINTNYHAAAMYQKEAIAGVLPDDVQTKTWRVEDRFTTFHRASGWWGLVEVRDTFGVWIRTRS